MQVYPSSRTCRHVEHKAPGRMILAGHCMGAVLAIAIAQASSNKYAVPAGAYSAIKSIFCTLFDLQIVSLEPF